jgi:hypothetical protein
MQDTVCRGKGEIRTVFLSQINHEIKGRGSWEDNVKTNLKEIGCDDVD